MHIRILGQTGLRISRVESDRQKGLGTLGYWDKLEFRN